MKKILKRILTAIAMVLVLPLVVSEKIAHSIMGRDVMFASQGDFLSLIPGIAGYLCRLSYYFFMLKSCSLDCAISLGTRFSHSACVISDRVYLGYDCILGYVEIGADTMLADRVSVLSGRRQHGMEAGNVPFQEQPKNFETIHIGKNCWIGTGAIIMADIGDNVIIGAGSVVTKPIASGEVAVGNPCRPIRKNSPEESAAVRQ